MSAYVDGFDAACKIGKYWDTKEVHHCPHAAGSNDAVQWLAGYADGEEELALWPDIVAALNWVMPEKETVSEPNVHG